jgi:hypothetical protein
VGSSKSPRQGIILIHHVSPHVLSLA